MQSKDQASRARAFNELHKGPAFLLPNAWDAMSALILEQEGFRAIATTSGGVSWALGYADGERTPWPDVVGAIERMAKSVNVPLSADIETGYAETVKELHDHVAQIIAAGAVGVNIEDRDGDRLRTLEDACARIRAAREAAHSTGVPIVVNARTDVFQLFAPSEQSEQEARRRVAAFAAAGASCAFLFGLSDLGVLKRVASSTPIPINVVGRAGGPGFTSLRDAGARRISIASGLALHAYGAVRSAAARLQLANDFECLRSDFPRAQAQAITSRTDKRQP